ncbi:MAG: cupredoxin domain-containing protein [Nitrososphaerales archaeon]
MDRTELLAIILVGAILIGTPLVIYYYQVNRVIKIMNYEKEIEIAANTFENGNWFPDKIVVKKGEPIRLIIYGSDVAHSLTIPKLGIDSGIIKPGHIKVIEFIPEEEGIYEIYCGIPCGSFHSFMIGKLIVVR